MLSLLYIRSHIQTSSRGIIADSLSISIHASICLFVYLLTIFGAVQRHFPPDLRYHGERCCVTPGGIQEEGELAGRRKKMDDNFQQEDGGTARNVSRVLYH